MDLRQYLNVLFVNKEQWHTVPDEVKQKMSFVLNRMMAMKWPLAAEALSKKGVDQAGAADIWFNSLRGIKGVPFWARFLQDKRPDKFMASYMAENELSESDLSVLKSLCPAELADDMAAYKEMYDANSKDELYIAKKEKKTSKKK